VLDRPGEFTYIPASNWTCARVAQLVEHATENRGVGGSNPPPGTTSFFNSIYIGADERPLTLVVLRVGWSLT
jgi:hypothetical protein